MGARPQFIKLAVVSRVLRKEFREVLIHTGQHYDYNMSDVFFEEMGIPHPDYNLGISGGSHGQMTGQILACAECLKQETDIRFLIYGSGEELDALKARKDACGLHNVSFKGRVGKKVVPFVLSKSNLNLLNYYAAAAGLYRFGSSQNKMFDYLASGRPLVENTKTSYDIVERYHCGSCKQLEDGASYATEILRIKSLPEDAYRELCTNARRAAEDYDFKNLTKDLIRVLEGI